MADELSKKGGERLDSRFKDFIDRVIVPILVGEYLAQSRQLAEEEAKTAHSTLHKARVTHDVLGSRHS